ncbi:MAG: hypothetical protein IJJ76_12270 [Ruminococcus sp.]|nr:hypothetical protein [Ruminococcus sp.]MBQ9542662.1 hypothetical protein [Ruminococcus sp.]MBR0530522.1 hypothetical protein [Ruminococcus sp.]
MKKIIDNRVYDTDTAQLIKQADHDNIISGEGKCKQSLYRKRTGDYFLCVYGARADSFHNLHLTDAKHDRERHIYLLTFEQARAWCEAEMTAEEWLENFEPAEDDSLAALNLTLSAAAVSKFKLSAQQQQISQKELMEKLIGTL